MTFPFRLFHIIPQKKPHDRCGYPALPKCLLSRHFGSFFHFILIIHNCPGRRPIPAAAKNYGQNDHFGACLPMLYCTYQIMLFCRRYRQNRSGLDYNDWIRAGTAQRSDKTWGITSICAPILTRRTDKGGLCIVHGLQRGRSGLYPDLQSLYRQIHEGRQ